MFIVDFDDTLFDTHAFKQARLEALEKLGVGKEIFWKTYYQARNDDSGNFLYNDRRHAQFLALNDLDEEKMFEGLSLVSSRLPDFLYPDAIDFLETLRKYNQTIILLSLGSPEFQEFKLNGVKIRHYFNNVFIAVSSKEQKIREIFEFEKSKTAWFFNDKVNETQDLLATFPFLRPVLKISPSIESSDYEKSGLPYFRTLSEIKDYVIRNF